MLFPGKSLTPKHDSLRPKRESRRTKWYLKNIPEAALFPSAQQLEAAAKKFEFSACYLRWLVIVGVLMAVLVINVKLFLEPLVPLPRGIDSLVWGGLPGLAMGLVPLVYVRKNAAKVLRQELLVLGVPICLACGYDLRGTVSERCSECGRELDARVREILAAGTASRPSPPT